VARLRAQGIKVVGATITSSLGCILLPNWGSSTTDTKCKEVNAFIRQSGIYDSVADMDAATVDPSTGQLKSAFVPDSTKGGPGDFLYLNRAGYQAIANSIDLSVLAPSHLSFVISFEPQARMTAVYLLSVSRYFTRSRDGQWLRSISKLMVAR
jgi:hypothetical protein